MISFKGAQYPKDVILIAVFFYLRYGVSYRDLKEIMSAPGALAQTETHDYQNQTRRLSL